MLIYFGNFLSKIHVSMFLESIITNEKIGEDVLEQ